LLDMDKLQATAQEAKDDFNNLQLEINTIKTRLEQITTLQKHIGAYRKTKDIYALYGRAKDKRKFYAEHEAAIETCKDTKAYFERLNLKKIPTIQALKQEYAALAAERGRLYKDYHPKRKFMREILTAEQNARLMLGSQTQRGLKRGDIER